MIPLLSSLDARVLDILYAYRDIPTVKIFIGVTELGGVVFVSGLVACLGLVFLLRRKYAYLAGLVISVAGAAGIMWVLKHLIIRPRPDIYYQAYPESGFSFPSGHATLAVAFYGFCIVLIRWFIPSPVWKNLATSVLTFLIAAIVFSRIYLGVHYLSDVVAGMALGGLFVWIGTWVVQRIGDRV
ncbi:MAG: phosphatase PAP2 family protein [Patescibacteria group bacterium]